METDLDKVCKKEGCFYSQTGSCVLGNDPLTCPDRLLSIADLANETIDISAETAVLSPPEEMKRFSASLSLTTKDAQKLSLDRYCKVVAILGVPGTGKTASLVSLYLLLAHSKLEGFRFLDSRSVMAFEEISKGARRWNVGKLPEQLTAHTELQDERIAGYLHLRLQQTEDSTIMDLLLTDLPGEWTTTLIDTNRTDRLGFLRSADRIWLTVNAEEIDKLSTRQFTIHRLSMLINRIKAFLSSKVPDITVVVTHSDKVPSVLNYLNSLQSLADGFDIKVIEIASFSGNDAVPAGFGIKAMIKDLTEIRKVTSVAFWPLESAAPEERHMLQYKNYRY